MTPQQIAKAAEDREKERQMRPTINGVVRSKPREFTQKELCNVQIMVDVLIDELGLRLKPDDGELPKLVNELLKTNGKAIDQYKQGNEKALNSIVGQVMKVTKAYDGAKIIAEITNFIEYANNFPINIEKPRVYPSIGVKINQHN